MYGNSSKESYFMLDILTYRSNRLLCQSSEEGTKLLCLVGDPYQFFLSSHLFFEKIIFRQLYATIRSRVSKPQFGFMHGRSTLTQLIIFCDTIYKTKDVNETLYALHLDFSKAFDKVPHDILVGKLQQIGVSGKLLKLLTNYLNNRSHSVMINNNYPDTLPITSGVQ